MNKISLVVLIFACSNLAFAQQKYFPFSVQGKHGIMDTLGLEVIKPIYAYSTEIPVKNQIYLQDFSSKPDIIFNAITGTKQSYESVYNDKVSIQNVPYSLVKKNGKQFLLSEETNKTINLSEGYSDFKEAGKYIIAKFYPKRVYSKTTVAPKNGAPPPPPPIVKAPEEQIAVLTNDPTLKRVLKGDFNKFLQLYKVAKKEEDNQIVEVILVSPDENKRTANFDYIVFSMNKIHSLYNEKLVLVKTFTLANASEETLQEACAKIVKQELSKYVQEEGYYPSVMAAPSSGSRRGNEVVEKKPFKPFFYTKELENGNTVFAFQETENSSKTIFEAKPGVEVYLDTRNFKIRLSIEGKKDSKFSFDPKTGRIYLPKAYFEKVGITVS